MYLVWWGNIKSIGKDIDMAIDIDIGDEEDERQINIQSNRGNCGKTNTTRQSLASAKQPSQLPPFKSRLSPQHADNGV